MLHHTTFTITEGRASEWLACLWQGPAPADLNVREWLTLAGEPRIAVLIWEGGTEARAFVDRAFGEFGQTVTREASSSAGMAFAVARNLDGYEQMMLGRKTDPAELKRQVDLRRRGMQARDQAAAMAVGRAWEAEGKDA